MVLLRSGVSSVGLMGFIVGVMALFKTMSGASPFSVPAQKWTLLPFDGVRVIPFDASGWSLLEVTLQVRYPVSGGPSTLRGRFVRRPGTKLEDETGHDDKDPLAGKTRHHHWQHFLKNSSGLTMGFHVWHDGRNPVIVDGRQFKFVAVSSQDRSVDE